MHHTKPIYGITWNKSKENIILSTSYDCMAVVFQIETENLNDLKSNGFIGSRKKDQMDSLKSVIKFKTAHPMPIFGCSWCHSNSNYFSTGCQDGIVRIFDYVSQVQIYRLCGHQGRSFNTVWSTLISGLLASGSDDKTINIWQIDFDNLKVDDSNKVIDLKPIRSLTGHTSNVRALCWNLEHKNILLSGSWDATIRIWDALKGILITVIRDHVADVYSICSHVTRFVILIFPLLSLSLLLLSILDHSHSYLVQEIQH
jgi:WD40 repeat protein